MLTGFSSQATTSNQSTDLLLQQLMAEMKYLRERVDFFLMMSQNDPIWF
jgi:hypothetical protein